MSKKDPMWVFENYGAAAELIDELDAKIATLESQQAASVGAGNYSDMRAQLVEAEHRGFIRGLNAEVKARAENHGNAASVGGEREAFEAEYAGRCNFERNPHHPDIYAHEPCRARWDAFQAGAAWQRATLSPAGGWAVPAEFLEHVKHARKELSRAEQSPLRVRQKLAQTLTDWLARLNAKPGSEA